MAKLPIVENFQAKPEATPLSPQLSKDFTFGTFGMGAKALQTAAAGASELSDKWQKAEDFSQTMDAKNRLYTEHQKVLADAEQFSNYKNPKELKAKEEEYLKQLSNTTQEINNGFTNNLAALEFQNVSSMTTLKNQEVVKEVFRTKTVDMGKANLMASLSTDEENFYKTNSPVYKKTAEATIQASLNAGYLTQAQAQKMREDLKEWDYNSAMMQAASNPNAVLANVKSGKYKNMTPDKIQNIKATAINGVETKIKEEDFNRQYNYAVSAGDIGKKALSGTLSFDELNKFLADNPDMPDKDKMFFAKQAGYTIKGEDLAKKGAVGDKLTPMEKQEAYANLQYIGGEMISGEAFTAKPSDIYHLLQDKDKKPIGKKVSGNVSIMMQKVNEYQSTLNDAYDKKIITKNQLLELSSNYAEPVREYLKSNLSTLGEMKGFKVLGYAQLTEFEKNMPKGGYKEQKQERKIEKGLLYSAYYNELVKASQEKKLDNVYGIEQLPSKEQQQIYKTAADNAIQYAKKNSANPQYWFTMDYPEYNLMPLSKETKGNAYKKIIQEPKANPSDIVGQEFAKQTMKELDNNDPMGLFK